MIQDRDSGDEVGFMGGQDAGSRSAGEERVCRLKLTLYIINCVDKL